MSVEKQFELADIMSAIKRRKLPAIILFSIVLLLMVAYALLAKPTYRSSATILIEQQEIPQDLVRTTVTSYADQRIQMTIQRVMTFPKLSKLIRKHNLYAEDRSNLPMELVVEKMRKNIFHEMISADVVDPRSGRPVEATIAFKIAFENKNAKVAQTVANELTSLFLNENIRNRTEMAENTEVFLVSEVRRLEGKSKELESALAKFKEENLRKLPELTDLNIRMLDRSEKEYFEIGSKIKSLEDQALHMQSQLSQQSPRREVMGDSRNTAVMTRDAQARYLQNSYVSLLAKYSEKHPDVIKARRELDRLVDEGGIPNDPQFVKAQINILNARLTRLKSTYADQHPDVQKVKKMLEVYKDKRRSLKQSPNTIEAADNPAYIQLATSLESVRAQIAHLNNSQAQVKAKWEALEKTIMDAPKVEQEYLSLSRDYDNTVKKYRELKEKQLQASLARTLEEERKSERFTLIESPLLPVKPERPNRPLIVMAGLMLASFFAAVLIFILEKADQTIRSDRLLEQLTGARPLAVIPSISTSAEGVAQGKNLWLIAAVVGALMLGGLLFVHFSILPLDVMWFQAMRKLG